MPSLEASGQFAGPSPCRSTSASVQAPSPLAEAGLTLTPSGRVIAAFFRSAMALPSGVCSGGL